MVSCVHQFNKSDDVPNNPIWLAWARPATNISYEGYYCCDYNVNVTVNKAVDALRKTDPSCFD